MKSFGEFSAMKQWKTTVARNIRKLTPEQARGHIDTINKDNKHGPTIHHEIVRQLTGGYNSQSINFHVMRALGNKAGIIK